MQYDIILITGDPFIDHPLNGAAILKRFLEKNKFKVGIIETPDWKSSKDFTKLGKPKLCFGITSGAMDSMVENYTPLKKERDKDEHARFIKTKPDRAILVYCNKIKENFKDTPIVIGGIEASLRRFTHYDYWHNKLRGSLLFDSRADILVYGSGEHALLDIAKRLRKGLDLKNIENTCIKSKELPKGFKELPSHEAVNKSKELFCDFQNQLTIYKNIAQKKGPWYLLQNKAHNLTSKELDEIYELPFTRKIPRDLDYFKGMQFSIVTHRGCVGNCNFCSLTLHQGNKIVSRSEASILKEIKALTKHKDFRGYIDDIGGPSANMYGFETDKTHKRLTTLLKRARNIQGVNKVFVRSGVRFDLALPHTEYLRELINHHLSGTLKIAPEHCSPNVLRLMNKPSKNLDAFISKFNKINNDPHTRLKFYFMTGHPGSGMREAEELADFTKKYRNVESIQLFTPTPMTRSTCMYYTNLDPKTKKRIYITHTYHGKKKQKNILFPQS